MEKPRLHAPFLRKLCTLLALFALIFLIVFVIRSFPKKESRFTDNVAGQIAQEMADNQIVLSSRPGRRTVADFQNPILENHGRESRLIVHTAHLSETISSASQGLGLRPDQRHLRVQCSHRACPRIVKRKMEKSVILHHIFLYFFAYLV